MNAVHQLNGAPGLGPRAGDRGVPRSRPSRPASNTLTIPTCMPSENSSSNSVCISVSSADPFSWRRLIKLRWLSTSSRARRTFSRAIDNWSVPSVISQVPVAGTQTASPAERFLAFFKISKKSGSRRMDPAAADLVHLKTPAGSSGHAPLSAGNSAEGSLRFSSTLRRLICIASEDSSLASTSFSALSDSPSRSRRVTISRWLSIKDRSWLILLRAARSRSYGLITRSPPGNSTTTRSLHLFSSASLLRKKGLVP
jgi:hypothetical protein